MKKIIAIIIFIVLIGALTAGLIYHIQQHKQPLMPADVLPAGAVIYVQASDVEKNIKEFVNTDVVKAITQIDFVGAMKMIGAKEMELAFYRNFAENIASNQNVMALSKLFGREVVAAFYLSDNTSEEVSGIAKMMDLLSSVSFVTRLSPEARFIELLTSSVSKIDSRVSETVQEYKKKKIHLLNIDGLFFKIGYVRFGDLLVFGVGDKAAKKAVDSVDNKKDALAQDPFFLASNKDLLDGAEVVGLFHYEKFMQKMKSSLLEISAMEKLDAAALRNIEEMFLSARGFKVFSFSGKYDQAVRARFDLTYDANEFSDEVKDFYSFSAQQNHSLSFVPRQALMYSWNALAGFDVYWNKAKQQVESEEMLPKSVQGWMKAGIPIAINSLGFDMDEALSLLTNEFGWYFLGVELSEIIPVINGVVFVGVSNMAQARDFIKKEYAAQGALRIITEEYEGVEIGYVDSIPFIQNIEPAYCVANNYLMVSPHRKFLKEAIDVAQGKKEALNQESIFMDSRKGLSTQGNAIFTLKISRLVNELKSVLVWANDWANVQYTRHQAFKKGAQQRLEDVKKDIEQKKEELDALEKTMLDTSEQREEFEGAAEDLDQINKDLENKKEFEAAAKKSVETFEEEEAKLLEVQEDEGMMLPEDGVKRLAYIQQELPKKHQRYNVLKEEMAHLEKRRQELTQSVERAMQLTQGLQQEEKIFAEKRAKMKAAQETQAELEEMIKGYDASTVSTPEQRTTVLEKIINPLMDGLGYVDWVGLKTMKTPDRIRSEFFMEIK